MTTPTIKTHLSEVRTMLKKCALAITLSTTLFGSYGFAQELSTDTASTLSFSFQNVVYPKDNFVQLLGINKNGTIAGYHGSGATGHPNQGFLLTLPNTFGTENVPGSVQTQVIGINDAKTFDGFYVDTKGLTHGFMFVDNQRFKTVDYPGTTFNQLLGVNNFQQAVGYYADANDIDHAYLFERFGNVFLVLTIPNSQGGAQATGINDAGWIVGFYIDGKGVNHGFLLTPGKLQTLDYPGSTFTQALGVDQTGNVVGTYNDASGLTHGFLRTNKGVWQQVDDPNGFGTTVVNGIGDNGKLVGFYVDGKGNTDGFVATPQ